ncbi:MAG TPA: PHB depolymerase family esterase [Baekduia sp.]|uniref:extracellular catalytic domain type 1 short-chain-length polyhydroxyalkanoate depolymerase n=1 Tax=Baekduia sp. TaxID=2600305 RepID=UPI002CE33A61|nr:PHB depolymerase family esterase [Baekduia sp.]HMJ35927.1 PHB depolymerase family esterase [Baekduia sp.]
MQERNTERTEALRPLCGTAPPARIVVGLRARLGIAVALLVAAGAALLPGAATAATGTLTSGDYAGPEGTQHYQLYVPSTYQAGTPMPLVVALHGCTQTADQFRRLTRWDALAEAKGFIVVFPEQDPSANSFKCWNFFQDRSMHRSAGEPARVAAVTTLVERDYAVDPQRVYAAGLSAGGAMASVMAATYPDLFAAIGVGSGCEYAATATCAGYKSADPVQAGRQAHAEMGAHARPMPFIAFAGDADTTVPPINADQLVQQWLVTGDLADDAALNGSVPRVPAKTTRGRAPGGRSYTLRSYVDSHRVELAQYWVVHGMSHAWSGGDPSQPYADPSGPDATAAMYTFFLSHRAPPRPPATTAASPPPGATPAPTPTPGAHRVAARKPRVPTVSKPKLSRGRFVFTISGRGSVTLLLQRGVPGHLKKGLCVAGRRKRHECTKYSTTAKIVRRAARAGQMAIAQPRKVHGHRLPRGRYRVVVTPASTAGRAGKSQTLELVLHEGLASADGAHR